MNNCCTWNLRDKYIDLLICKGMHLVNLHKFTFKYFFAFSSILFWVVFKDQESLSVHYIGNLTKNRSNCSQSPNSCDLFSSNQTSQLDTPHPQIALRSSLLALVRHLLELMKSTPGFQESASANAAQPSFPMSASMKRFSWTMTDRGLELSKLSECQIAPWTKTTNAHMPANWTNL